MKKEIVVLVAIIAALGAYIALQRSDQVQYQLPELALIEPDSITRIEISNGEKAVVLDRAADDIWQVGEAKYKADAHKAERIVEVISALRLTTLVAESEDYHRFALDPEQRVRVKAWVGEDLKRTFDVGKAADTFRHTFVKLEGDPRVFHAEKNFQEWFKVSTEDLRDKRVLSFDEAKIERIVLTHKGKSVAFIRSAVATEQEKEEASAKADEDTLENAVPTDTWQTEDGLPADATKVATLLSLLASLDCQRFLGENPTSAPEFEIALYGEDETHTLTIYHKVEIDEQTLWPATSSQSASAFELPDWKAQDIIKVPDDLLIQAPDNETQE